MSTRPARPATVRNAMPAHTPGPWAVQQLETDRHGYDWPTFAVRSPANVCLAVVGEVDRYESERIPANARLIAAAPDMLAALRDALDELAVHNNRHAAMSRIRAILAQVEGR